MIDHKYYCCPKCMEEVNNFSTSDFKCPDCDTDLVRATVCVNCDEFYPTFMVHDDWCEDCIQNLKDKWIQNFEDYEREFIVNNLNFFKET